VRTTQLVTSYIQTVLFLALAFRCILSWQRTKEKRAAHLAVATTLYSINSLMSAVTNTFINTRAGEQAPRWESILSTIVLYAAILAFLVFLGDFVRFPIVLKYVAVVSIIVNMVLAIFIKVEPRFIGNCKPVPQPDCRLDITHRGYVIYILTYIAIAFAILGFSFLYYGSRVDGLARFRLLCIGSSFTVFFILIGILPLWLFQKPTADELQTLTNVFSYIALITAPLLYVGFAPPRWITSRFGEQASPEGKPAIQT
jgi:hypothetical protein